MTSYNLDPRRPWAEWYVALGWKVFKLARDDPGGKKPHKNCDRCAPESSSYEPHDMETCPCLLCHGFYAATDDVARVDLMLQVPPMTGLSVRTGRASGVVVLDVEHEGLDLLDQWEQFNGWSLPRTLTARSVSGGLHLWFRYPANAAVSSGELEPGLIDVASDGHYVGVPSGDGRREWVDTSVAVATMPDGLIRLLTGPRRARVRSGTGTAGSAAGGGGPLPPTDEFEAHGLGWFTGSRNKDAYRLAFRLWAKGFSERDVAGVLYRCWEATGNKSASSWHEIWRTALSAHRRHGEARQTDLAAVEKIVGGRYAGR